MEKIAINIALLPPQEITKKAIAINKQIVRNYGAELVLGKTKNLPHITLVQSCTEKSYLQEIETLLSKIACFFPPLLLKVNGIKYNTNWQYSSFEIEKSEELQKLHETIILKCEPFLTFDKIEQTSFHEPTSEKLLEYVVRFREESAFEKYKPHITLGKGKAEQVEPIEFTANKLILAHLGANGTCAKVLFATYLK